MTPRDPGRVFMTCPTLRPHGGVRVILEWANRLPNVVLRVPAAETIEWGRIAPHVKVATDDTDLASCGVLIVTSPHGDAYLDHPDAPDRRFVFLQMMEHMFRISRRDWVKRCYELYLRPEPLVLISDWNERTMREEVGRTGEILRVGNGVNLKQFPIERVAKRDDVVLVEGWNPGNRTKDIGRIAHLVADRLKADGCTILAYDRRPPQEHRRTCDEFHVRPDLATMNDLYRRATILVKASRWDARACAPMEAMTKGTVTARAIIEGDDDLTPENSLRTLYHQDALYRAARRLLDDTGLRNELADNCLRYAEEHSWDKVMPRIRETLSV